MRSEVENEDVEPTTGHTVALWRYAVVLVMLLLAVPALRKAEKAQISEGTYGSVGLKDLPMSVGDWHKDVEVPIDKISQEQLVPDDFIDRQYKSTDGMPLDYLVVYGHLKQTFHDPGFCLPGGGFQILDESVIPVEVDGGETLSMNLFQMQKDKDRLMVLFCFVQGQKSTPSLLVQNWNLLIAHARHERATGALMRVIIPAYPNDTVAVERAKDFIRRIYPDLQKRIQ